MAVEKKRVVSIEERTSFGNLLEVSFESGDAVGVTIENTGTATVYIGWNEKAMPGKGRILPGTSKSFGMGWPYFLSPKKKLSVDFEDIAGLDKNVTVTIFRDGGELTC